MIYLRLLGAEPGCSMNAVVQWVIPFHAQALSFD
jgi:hypothetical protein